MTRTSIISRSGFNAQFGIYSDTMFATCFTAKATTIFVARENCSKAIIEKPVMIVGDCRLRRSNGAEQYCGSAIKGS